MILKTFSIGHLLKKLDWETEILDPDYFKKLKKITMNSFHFINVNMAINKKFLFRYLNDLSDVRIS